MPDLFFVVAWLFICMLFSAVLFCFFCLLFVFSLQLLFLAVFVCMCLMSFACCFVCCKLLHVQMYVLRESSEARVGMPTMVVWVCLTIIECALDSTHNHIQCVHVGHGSGPQDGPRRPRCNRLTGPTSQQAAYIKNKLGLAQT